MASGESVFVRQDGALVATEWAVGPWTGDALQGGATGGRLSFDLWRPVSRGRTEVDTEILRDGRKRRLSPDPTRAGPSPSPSAAGARSSPASTRA